ncbi:MAG: tetratricopeptide repeat protein [Treponema sp.]|jgi:tetratricopeptide (TPR) repeat protein|nr:tetratricopeptide repeat protein [Treponema sp.]
MFGFMKAGFLKKLPLLRTLNARQKPSVPDEIVAEKWDADFSKPYHIRFDIKSETAYDANLRDNALVLGLKKTNCIAWVEAPGYPYLDQVIDARFRLDPRGGYAAAGFLFRMADEGTYYALLISNRGYFRLDVLRNGMPFPLIGWTETPAAPPPESPALDRAAPRPPVWWSRAARKAPKVPEGRALLGPGPAEGEVTLKIIAYGSHILLVINGSWAAELQDPTITSGELCFALASYGAKSPEPPGTAGDRDPYTAAAFLDALSVESRITEVAACYEGWSENPDIAPQSRFRLAETFAAMGQPGPALAQLKKAWGEHPDYRRSPRELLLAGRLALALELPDEAEGYITTCLAEAPDSPEAQEAAIERAKILYAAGRFGELKSYGEAAATLRPQDAVLAAFLGHAYWNLKEYEKAAAAYDRAFELDGENGLLAKNAANVYEVLGRREEALERYLRGGRAFLRNDNYEDLGSLIPRLLSLGAAHWEARGLAGKWAFGIENWAMAEEELALAEKQRKKLRPRPPADPALIFLKGLLLLREGKRREALKLLDRAALLAPDYALFRFKAAENRFLLENNAEDPRLIGDLTVALELLPEDGWIRNFAAQIALQRGNLGEAAEHLEKALASLGDLPAIRVNRGVLTYLQGFPDQALEILTVPKEEDPEGIMANCAGNLLIRGGRYEEADAQYQRALAAAPDNTEYLNNRAACLIELGRYGEADAVLARAHSLGPSPEILELISYVASKKGEYARAESACQAALEIDNRHGPSLLSLGWIYKVQGRWEDLKGIISRLDTLELPPGALPRREELRQRLEEALTKHIACASCGRSWKVPRDAPPAPPIRIFAMPPDHLPGGTCISCGKTYCIGCAKERLDPEGRFICPQCGRPLKLLDEGLKKLLYDWASTEIPGMSEKIPLPENTPPPDGEHGPEPVS